MPEAEVLILRVYCSLSPLPHKKLITHGSEWPGHLINGLSGLGVTALWLDGIQPKVIPSLYKPILVKI